MTTVATEEITRYRVPAENLNGLKEKIEKLNKRAAKLGCSAIEVDEHETETMLVIERDLIDIRTLGGPPTAEMTEDRYAQIEADPHWDTPRVLGRRTYTWITVEGDAPKLEGWTFIATITPVAEVGNLLRSVPGQEIPDRYRTAGMDCDHCGYARNRLNTYVVRHDDGTHKQVGSNCLADFLGHRSPQAMASWASILIDLDDTVRAFTGEARTEDTVPVAEYLSWVAATIHVHGWLSKGAAWNQDRTWAATANLASSEMHRRAADMKFADEEIRAAFEANEDADKIEKALEWIRSLTEADYADSDYLWNLFATCSKDYMTYKEEGIVGSLLKAYDRNVEKIIAERERSKRTQSEWQGEVKERLRGLTITLMSERTIERDPYESRYPGEGNTYLYMMKDENGNEFKWFASSRQQWEIGETWTIDGTVIKHDEYKGIKATQVNRVKLKEKVADAPGSEEENGES